MKRKHKTLSEPTAFVQNYLFDFYLAHMDWQLSLVNKTEDLWPCICGVLANIEAIKKQLTEELLNG